MSVVPYNNSSRSSGACSASPALGLPRSTFLLSRPACFCRCDLCTLSVREGLELSILDPYEPLMIPTLSSAYGWWNVRLPSKLLEPVMEFVNAEYICVDEDLMSFLEEKKVINWCPGLRQLYPIRTTGDGNCLMHAVILATCGIQDSGLVLRRLVYVALVEAASNSFRERWQKEKQRLNESIPGGLQYTSEEWDKEWSMVVNTAEDLRKTTMAYEFLEEMHVFVLANVICRPIIILGESTVRSPLAGDSIEQNNFVGIYLPLLWNPKLCDPNPVVLCFLHSHFQPLISRYKFTSEPKDLLAIPLVTSRLEPLHIHFLLPEEETFAHDLLLQYLWISEVPRKSEDGSSDEAILVAEILYSAPYYNWEHKDYLYLTKDTHAQLDAQKIAQVPSKSSMNYIQPVKGKCLVHSASHDLYQPRHLLSDCCNCKEMGQKSIMGQLDSSLTELESSLGRKENVKGHLGRSTFYQDQSKNYPDCLKIHADGQKIHPDFLKIRLGHSVGGNLDSANQNTNRQYSEELHSKQAKNLPVLGQGRHQGQVRHQREPEAENVAIFNTLKKLNSSQPKEGATWRESHSAEDRQSSVTLDNRGQHFQGAVGRGPGWSNTGYRFQSQTETCGGSFTKTVRARAPVGPSVKPGNARGPAVENRSQPQRKLSDISDVDVEYIRQKFTLKTPIYCRSLSLLGKQCAKPDCKRFVAKEPDFCCPVHAHPPLLSSKEYLTPSAVMNDKYVRSQSNSGTKSTSTYQKPCEAPAVSVVDPKVKCITDGCNGHGYSFYLGLCAGCVLEELIVEHSAPKGATISPLKMDHKVAADLLNQTKCITEGCKSLSNAGYMGLCVKCYLQAIVLMESEEEKALPYGETQSLKSVTKEEVEQGRVQVYENAALETIRDNFDDWFDKKYPPQLLGAATSTEPPVLWKAPVRSVGLPRAGGEMEMKDCNAAIENKESLQSEDKQIDSRKDDCSDTGCQKNVLERSIDEEQVEASQEDVTNDDLPSLIAEEETLQPNLCYGNDGELSSDDVVLVELSSLRPARPIEGLWTLLFSIPDSVASEDEPSVREEFLKCLSTSCEHVATNMFAGGYCATCYAARLLGYADATTGGLAEGVAKEMVKMPTLETLVPCVTEGCRNSVALAEFGLCIACYVCQLEASTTLVNRSLRSPPQKSDSSSLHQSTKARETSRSSQTASSLPSRATPCLKSSCDRYGDPAYGGYCSQCAKQFENSALEIDSC